MFGKIFAPFIFLFLFSTSVSGQGDKMEDGYTIFKYPNGTVSSEGTIRDGLPDGYWKSYFVTGVKKSEGKRRNFMLDSIWVFYSQTGDTLEKIDYLSGKKSGYYLKYKRDNLKGLYIWSRELYAADKREGLAWQYYPDGSVKLIIPYKNGKKDGLSKEFDEHGVIITLYEYSDDFLVSRERINRIDKDGHKQGEWRDFYDDGTLKRELTYVNDQVHGYYREYNEKGVLVSIMLYDNGVLVEESVDDDPEIEIVNRYDTSGNLIYSGPFRNSIPVGVHREYDGTGNIINSFVYNDNGLKMSEGVVDEEGNRQGEWKIVFPDGTVKERGNYIDNRRNGPWSFYDSDSKLVQRGAYRNGRAEGQWVWFYSDGSVLREEDYYQGRRDGSFVEYSKTGELLIKGEYADGEKNGIWIYTVGDHREEGNYIIGLRDGVWKYFDNEENLLYKGNYVQDNPDGYHTYFWENGRVKEEQYYSMGIMQRTWKKYDDEGAVLMTISYKDGVERRINGIKVNLPESEVKLIK
jgi:antitoxin component YwqK of YwqJK toxin-antitoxin module